MDKKKCNDPGYQRLSDNEIVPAVNYDREKDFSKTWTQDSGLYCTSCNSLKKNEGFILHNNYYGM